MPAYQLDAGFLVTSTLWLQSAGTAVLGAWMRHAAEGDIHKNGPSTRIRAGREIHDRGGPSARLGDSAVDDPQSVELITLLGLSVLLFGEQLFDCWLQRSNSASRFATVWAVGEQQRRVDMQNIREPSLRDNNAAHQSRCALIAQIAEARYHGCSLGVEGLLMQESPEPRTHSQCRDSPRNSPLGSRSRWAVGGDDAATIVAICVSLLIVLACALAYIILVGLVIMLASDLAHICRHVPTY
jgi:hypothetical protein